MQLNINMMQQKKIEICVAHLVQNSFQIKALGPSMHSFLHKKLLYVCLPEHLNV